MRWHSFDMNNLVIYERWWRLIHLWLSNIRTLTINFTISSISPTKSNGRFRLDREFRIENANTQLIDNRLTIAIIVSDLSVFWKFNTNFNRIMNLFSVFLSNPIKWPIFEPFIDLGIFRLIWTIFGFVFLILWPFLWEFYLLCWFMVFDHIYTFLLFFHAISFPIFLSFITLLIPKLIFMSLSKEWPIPEDLHTFYRFRTSNCFTFFLFLNHNSLSRKNGVIFMINTEF